MSAAAHRVADAHVAIDLVAEAGLSLILRARAGPVRDALLAQLSDQRAMLKITAEADVAALVGGIDAMASVATGAPVRAASLAERLGGRVLLVTGAERVGDTLAAVIAGLIDARALTGLMLIDEGIDDERVPMMLADRVTMIVDTEGLSWRDLPLAVPEAEAMPVEGDGVAALCDVAAALGIVSLRAPGHALTVVRALQDANGVDRADQEHGCDVARAVRLALGPRARRVPEAPPEPPPPDEQDANDAPPPDTGEGGDVSDRLIEAALMSLPPGLLDGGAMHGGVGKSGSTDARNGGGGRGRRGRVRQAMPQGGARLDLVATLIAAAPMQRLRGRGPGDPIAIRRDDVRVRRPVPTRRRATIFAVDASGSAALARLAEVKGAVERLLGESYVRRDEVGLIAFRGEGAETLLPPTRSLARARRELAALPGGGATPLASGIAAGLDQALRSRAAGRAPLLVVLTDGGANIARDGTPGRAGAQHDAETVARGVAAAGIPALVIDSAPRGDAKVRALATAMAARYIALPRADDQALARAVGAAR